jgi:endogenous inhibitor of DNA gyrase (YacG/DUF329 family)
MQVKCPACGKPFECSIKESCEIIAPCCSEECEIAFGDEQNRRESIRESVRQDGLLKVARWEYDNDRDMPDTNSGNNK